MDGESIWNGHSGMDHTIEPLVHDLVQYVGHAGRSYAEVMESWRTSCPRLPIWEEAIERGLLARTRDATGIPIVTVTAAGRAFLLDAASSTRERPASATPAPMSHPPRLLR